jgi:hypothetical protein
MTGSNIANKNLFTNMHHRYQGMWSRLVDPLSWVLLETLTVAQLLKELSALYRTVFRRACHRNLSWATFSVSWRSVLISFNLRLGPASDPLPSDSDFTCVLRALSTWFSILLSQYCLAKSSNRDTPNYSPQSSSVPCSWIQILSSAPSAITIRNFR